MSDAYLGEIRLFGGNYAPLHWAFCEGQILPIANYEALYSLIGMVYGGDGRTTFALPDFRGRIPVHSGKSAGPGLPAYPLGAMGGQEAHTITTNEMPVHNHDMNVVDQVANSGSPYQGSLATAIGPGQKTTNFYATYDQDSTTWMATDAMATGGGANLAHDNMMPSLAISFIICTQGLYPSRS